MAAVHEQKRRFQSVRFLRRVLSVPQLTSFTNRPLDPVKEKKRK